MNTAPARATEIAAGLALVRQRIAAAAHAAGRAPSDVRLIAVSKTMPAEDVRLALTDGQADFGENYAQEFRDKHAALAAEASLRWHFIGPLQTNKVKYVAGKVTLIHGVASVALLDEIERRTPAGTMQGCLVQVNVAREPQKSGVDPDGLPALLDAFAGRSRVRCEGLMVIPPLAEAPEAARPHFGALRVLRERHGTTTRPNVDLRELSMGMSGDLEVAIAEGATLIRVGTAIFGERTRA